MTFRTSAHAAIERVAHRLLGIDELVSVCKAMPPGTPETWSARLLDALNVSTRWAGLPVEQIPKSGPLLVVANHPFGLVEAIALEVLLLSLRPDVSFIAWHFIGDLPGIGRRHIFVDPQRLPENRKRNFEGWRTAIRQIEKGGVVGVFPAGQVARFNWQRMAVSDPPWNPHIGRLARKTRAPVLPVWFDGRNSTAFQIAAMLMPTLHQSLVVREVNNKRGSTLHGTIGPVIGADELASFESDEEAVAFLRARTEALRSQR